MAWGWLNKTGRGFQKAGRGLKKAGVVTFKGAKVAGKVALAVGLNPSLGGIIKAVPAAVAAAEQEFGRGNGPEKRARATERIVRLAVLWAERVMGIGLDEDRIAKIAGPLIDAWVEFRNARKNP